MSDESKREELKARINEKLDELSIEDLEKVAGGYIIYDGDYVCPECGRTFSSYDAYHNHQCGFIKG